MFSGGCNYPGPATTGTGGYRNNDLNGVARGYSGENGSDGSGVPVGQELTEWNFNSRMDKSSSANRNPATAVRMSGSDMSAEGAVTDGKGQVPTKLYTYYNPNDPHADRDGYVTVELPDYSNNRQPSIQSGATASQYASHETQPGMVVAGSEVQSQLNAQSQAEDVSGQPRTLLSQQYQPDQPALPPLPGNIQPGLAQAGLAASEPMIKPAVVTGITVNGQNPVLVGYSPETSSVPAVPATTQTSWSAPSVVQGAVQTSGTDLAMPRLQDDGQNTTSQLPVVYAGTGQNTAIAARAEYSAPALQRPAVSNVEDLAASLEKLLSDNPQNVDLQMALRYAYAARGEYDKALQELKMVPIENQRDSIALARATILSSQLAANNDPMVANSALSAIRSLQDKVASKADLKISTFKICSRVDNFGQYQEVAKSYLETGNACQVLVYCELENYQYKQDEEGKYSTSLHAEITLFDASLNVLQILSEDVVDTPSYNKRKDFFLRGPFKMPQLKAGKYQIVISMEDKVAGKKALAARYNFEVKATTTGDAAEIPGATIGENTSGLQN